MQVRCKERDGLANERAGSMMVFVAHKNAATGAGLKPFLAWRPRQCLSFAGISFVLLLVVTLFAAPARSQSAPSISPADAIETTGSRTIVHLLDYIAVDYSEAVADGKIKNADEFKEMVEFAGQVQALLLAQPDSPGRAGLIAAAEQLSVYIAARRDVAPVAAAALKLRDSVIADYGLAIGPRRSPDLARGSVLYTEHCAACHGVNGRGDGVLAKSMEPVPSNFHDRERMAQRSVFGLFNTITLGVGGTAMSAYRNMSDADRWALAFHTANLGADITARARGKTKWDADGSTRDGVSLAMVAGRSEQEWLTQYGGNADVLAWLRSTPQVLDQAETGAIVFARRKLAESLELARAGRRNDANRAALVAYLEGFELIEAALQTVDAPLMRRVERDMVDYRNGLNGGMPISELEKRAAEIDLKLVECERAIGGPGLSPGAVFLASFVILFREGLEAVLVVTALLAFVRRSGQHHALPYLHAGWVAALILGIGTWLLAATVIRISGADREITEGVTALIASAMLLYVGFWLHGKSHAAAWQEFLMRGVKAIRPGAAWGLSLIAFLAVYREVFETVLFYQALSVQAGGHVQMLLGGLAAAAVSLAAITWAMLKYSLKLPLGMFFGASGLLLAALAVVLAGNGIAALQEAGAVPITPVAFFTVPWLGIYPSAQSLAIQAILVTMTITVVLQVRTRSRARPTATQATVR